MVCQTFPSIKKIENIDKLERLGIKVEIGTNTISVRKAISESEWYFLIIIIA